MENNKILIAHFSDLDFDAMEADEHGRPKDLAILGGRGYILETSKEPQLIRHLSQTLVVDSGISEVEIRVELNARPDMADCPANVAKSINAACDLVFFFRGISGGIEYKNGQWYMSTKYGSPIIIAIDNLGNCFAKLSFQSAYKELIEKGLIPCSTT